MRPIRGWNSLPQVEDVGGVKCWRHATLALRVTRYSGSTFLSWPSCNGNKAALGGAIRGKALPLVWFNTEVLQRDLQYIFEALILICDRALLALTDAHHRAAALGCGRQACG